MKTVASKLLLTACVVTVVRRINPKDKSLEAGRPVGRLSARIQAGNDKTLTREGVVVATGRQAGTGATLGGETVGLSFPGAQPPQAPLPTRSPRLLAEKRQELLDQANKLRTGLFKIDETREKVEVMSLELEDAKKKVAEFQKQCEEYLVIIVQQKREADEQQKVPPPSTGPAPRTPCSPQTGGRGLPASTAVTKAGAAWSMPHVFFSLLFHRYQLLLLKVQANPHLLFIPRPSQPIVRRLRLRKSSARPWLTMPRRI